MKSIPKISEAELEVMKVLWELESATSTQIVDQLSKTSDWKPKTIHTLITRLVKKKAINASRIDGKSYLYTPELSEDSYKSYLNQSFLKKVYNGSVNLMISSFIKEHKLTKEEIDELKQLLDQEVE